MVVLVPLDKVVGNSECLRRCNTKLPSYRHNYVDVSGLHRSLQSLPSVSAQTGSAPRGPLFFVWVLGYY